MIQALPDYCRSSFAYLESYLQSAVKRGKLTTVCRSAGGRNVYAVEYGVPNAYRRTANYSSAAGAGDLRCYADKTHPCIMLIGGVHGAEFEGIAALCNVISLLETGVDLAGREQQPLLDFLRQVHLLLVPCANPDGRARVPFEGAAGMTLEEFRYYAQGAWADGSLCGWPGCKKEHPIKQVSFMGGYYNDDGVNLMHDTFFEPMAAETKALLHLASAYAPDVIVNLHGAADMGYGMYAGCLDANMRSRAQQLEARLCRRFEERGFRYLVTGCGKTDPDPNLATALALACGALSVTWESYQGVAGQEHVHPEEHMYDDILQAHYLFFEETVCFAAEWYRASVSSIIKKENQ